MSQQSEKKVIPFSEAFKIAAKALKINLKTKSKGSLLIHLLGFGIAFVPSLIAILLRQFTDQMQLLFGTKEQNISTVLTLFLVIFLFYILQTLFTFIQNYYSRIDRNRIDMYIKESVMRCACKIKYKYIENYEGFTEKIQFIETDATNSVINSVQNVILWLQSLLTFGSIIFVLAGVSIWIALILIAPCIPAAILASKQRDGEYHYKVKWMREGHLITYYYFLGVRNDNIQEVRHWWLYDYIDKQWHELIDAYMKIKRALNKKYVGYNASADFLRNVVYIGVLLLTAFKIYQDPAVGVGTYILIYNLSSQLQSVTEGLFVKAAQFWGDIPYMKDFFSLEKLEKEPFDLSAKILDSAKICFDHVNFTYPGSTVQALKDLNVTIKPGEKIAIVGENGSGKSTFANLLCGLYEPDSGSVTINGQPLQQNLTALRRSISAAFQTFANYDATLRENITISDPSRQVNDDELELLVRQIGMYDVIEAQPNKFDEVVGTFSEKGNNLSGGQWQKVAIARAAFRNKSKIMLLDEPTASLDPLAEARLYGAFSKLSEDRTTILISHRLGITKLVDRILVFDDGRIVEDGTHEELLQQNGLFTKLYEAQAKWYQEASVTI